MAGPASDAFGRVRISDPHLLLDLKRVGSVPDLVASNAVSGTGAANYDANRASTALTVGPAVGVAQRRSKSRAVYQPGKSMLVFQTFIMEAGQSGLLQQAGLFDDSNGILFQKSASTLSFVQRSYVSGSVVNTAVAQSSWNLDKLDGTGASGITLDSTKPQILVIDLEWLGVGRVRCGFVIDGCIAYAHQFLNANGSLASVYMSNPNLPLSWRIEATEAISGTATLEAVCGSVSSEGGYQIVGINAATDSGIAGKSVATATNVELLAIRLQSAFSDVATAIVRQLSAMNTTDAGFRWRLVLNPTETDAGTWAAVPNTVMEKNTTRTVTEDTGLILDQGYVPDNINFIDIDPNPVLTLGKTLAGVHDVISLQVRHLTDQTETFYGSVAWREIY